MACSAILVLDLKGKVLLARDYRGDIPLKYADRFISKVNELEDAGKLTPVIADDDVTYLYVQVRCSALSWPTSFRPDAVATPAAYFTPSPSLARTQCRCFSAVSPPLRRM